MHFKKQGKVINAVREHRVLVVTSVLHDDRLSHKSTFPGETQHIANITIID